MIVGFTAWMKRTTEVFRSKRVNCSNVETRLSKCSLDRTMIDTSHLDSDNGIRDLSDLKFIGNKNGHRFQRSSIVFDRGWFDDHFAIEVAKHPLGSTFSAIDRNDDPAYATPGPDEAQKF